MLNLEIQEKYVGFISRYQLIKNGEWRLNRIPPLCEVCACENGYKVMKLYTQFIFKSKPLMTLQCSCCGDRTELEFFEYDDIKTIVKLNHKKTTGKIDEMHYVKKMEKIL